MSPARRVHEETTTGQKAGGEPEPGFSFAENEWVEVHRIGSRNGVPGRRPKSEGQYGKPRAPRTTYGCWFFPVRGSGKFVNIGRPLVLEEKPRPPVNKSEPFEWEMFMDSACPHALARGYDSVVYKRGLFGLGWSEVNIC